MSKAEISVLERRLKPIYDGIDGQNYKKALSECDKVLKKHPNTTAAKVLKALTLIRLEKLADAMEIIEALDIQGAHHDELTLQAFVHCYRDSNQHMKVVTLYERAIEVDGSEHNLTQLFMAYTRQRMYKEAQKIALRLYKDFGNTPYYFWSVMALVMQANENPELGQKMLLPLADKMCQTQIKKTGYTEGSSAEQELQLMILEGMKKWTECADFIDRPEATALPMAPYNLVEKGLEFLMKAKDYTKVDDLALNAIEELHDNWNLWRIIVESTFYQVELCLTADPRKARNLMNRLATLIKSIQKKSEFKLRAPLLVHFYVFKVFRKLTDPIPEMDDLTKVFGDPVEKMIEYVGRFYKKPVCFVDLQMFFVDLSADQKSEFLKKLAVWIRDVSAEDDVEGDESKVWAIILSERCRRALGDYEKLDAAGHRSLFQQCIAQIAAPERSEHAQGVLANLTTAHLWDAYRKENDVNKFYEMILLLEYVATSNKTDPVCKLQLIRAYSALCTTGRIAALVKTLDIKAIQMDTLGHLTFPCFETAGRFNLAVIQNTQLSMMYEQAEKEIQECISQSYRNGKFSAIPKMTAVSEKLRLSAQKSACEVMNRYLSSLFVLDDLDQITVTLWGADDSIGEKEIDWKTLIDTRDFEAIPYSETEEYEKLFEDMKRRSFKELLDISQLRSCMCRALGAVGRLTQDNMDARLARVQLKMTVIEFRDHLNYCCNEYPSFLIESKLAQSPAPHHLAQWVHSGGPQMILEYLEATVKLIEILDSGEHPDIALVGTRTEMAKKLIKLIDVPPKRIEGEKLPPFWIVEPIIKSSRALQTIAGIQVVLRLIERAVLKLAQNVPTTLPESAGKPKGKKEKKAQEEAIAKALDECKAVVFLEHIRAMHVELRYAGNFLHSHFSQMMAFEDDNIPKTAGEDLGKDWIQAREEETLTSFLKNKTEGSDGLKVTSYYTCQHEGGYESHGLKRVGHTTKKKTGDASCPAFLKTTSIASKNSYKAVGCFSHYGHESEVANQRLQDPYLEIVKNMLNDVFSDKQIVSKLRKEYDPTHRLFYITPEDLRNYRRQFQLWPERRDQNDLKSIEMRITENKLEDGIRHYQSPTDSCGTNFQLVIITPSQLENLKKYSSRGIILDDTHNVTKYTLKLSTLVVVDGYDRGIPAAFLLSHSTTGDDVAELFKCVKNLMPEFSPRYVMSDEAYSFYNAFLTVFPNSLAKKVLCRWHVLRTWKKHSKETLKAANFKIVFEKLRAIIREPVPVSLCRRIIDLLHFLENLDNDEGKAFYEYFKRNYLGRIAEWSTSTREGIICHTSMFAESWHSMLKEQCLGQKLNIRVDTLLEKLYEAYNWIIQKNSVQSHRHLSRAVPRLGRNRQHCRRAQEQCSEYEIHEVQPLFVGDKDYLIGKSGSPPKNFYRISDRSACTCLKDENCHCDCSACGYRWTCTCLVREAGVACKHIHMLIKHIKQKKPIQVMSKDTLGPTWEIDIPDRNVPSTSQIQNSSDTSRSSNDDQCSKMYATFSSMLSEMDSHVRKRMKTDPIGAMADMKKVMDAGLSLVDISVKSLSIRSNASSTLTARQTMNEHIKLKPRQHAKSAQPSSSTAPLVPLEEVAVCAICFQVDPDLPEDIHPEEEEARVTAWRCCPICRLPVHMTCSMSQKKCEHCNSNYINYDI